MKNLILFLLIAFCTSVFAQSNTESYDKTYVYFKEGQSQTSLKKEIQNYEAILTMAGYEKKATQTLSSRDYTILWYQKLENGIEINAQIHYEFLSNILR